MIKIISKSKRKNIMENKQLEIEILWYCDAYTYETLIELKNEQINKLDLKTLIQELDDFEEKYQEKELSDEELSDTWDSIYRNYFRELKDISSVYTEQIIEENRDWDEEEEEYEDLSEDFEKVCIRVKNEKGEVLVSKGLELINW